VDHPPCKPHRHLEPTTSTQAGVSRAPAPPTRRALATLNEPNVQHSAAAEGRRLQCSVRPRPRRLNLLIAPAGRGPLGGHSPRTPLGHREPTTGTQAGVSRVHRQPASPARTSAQRPRRSAEDNVRHVNLDAPQHPVSSKPPRPASRAQASCKRQHGARDGGVWHVNLDAHQHSLCREPLRPASSAELQHSDRVGVIKTTCGTLTSTRIRARSAARPLDQLGVPRLHA
jgi:hypothetical protein